MRAVQVPYLQSIDAGSIGPWELHLEGGSAPLPEFHPAWDAGVDVRVSCSLALDGERFMRETGLAQGSSVRLVAGYECEQARSRSFPWRRSIALPSGFSGSVEFVAPAERLAHSMELVVGAVLMQAGTGSSAISARTPGSWLWVNRAPFALHGGRGRFPMEWIAFPKSGLPRNAAWFLDWPSQDWSAPALGTMRLLFNSSHGVIRKVVDLPEQDSRRRIIVQSAKLDVAKQLIIAALSSPEFLSEADQFDEGSIGYSVRLLISSAFPHDTPMALKERLTHHAGEFHAQLQDGLGALDVEIE